MPSITGTDSFDHGNFTVPGGANYTGIGGTPAKDTTFLRYPDTASLLIEVTDPEYVEHTYGSATQLPWRGYFMSIEVFPNANVYVGQLWDSGYTYKTGIALSNPGTGITFTFNVNDGSGSNYSTTQISLNTWYWIEEIIDGRAATVAHYARVQGYDVGVSTNTGGPISFLRDQLGFSTVGGAKYRFSHSMWGVASSITDWLGVPVGVPPPPVSKISVPITGGRGW